MIKEGIKFKDIHDYANKRLDGEFLHLIGHGIGIDVHESPQMNDILKENMIITIEPGIYFPEKYGKIPLIDYGHYLKNKRFYFLALFLFLSKENLWMNQTPFAQDRILIRDINIMPRFTCYFDKTNCSLFNTKDSMIN